MGKQINYWMEYESFLLLAQKAVELGCTVMKEDARKVIESRDTSIVTPDHQLYYFHLPEAGAAAVHVYGGRELVDHGFSASGSALIEAGYSFITEDKEIRRARIYCITGYYDGSDTYISRPECLAKVYSALARYVKKIAPYTELVDIRISMRDETYGEEYEYRHKEYVTKACLELVDREGYRLC